MSIGLSVRLSVCPSVCFYSIFWTDWPLNFSFCMCVGRNHNSLALKVKVMGQGQMSTRSVWPRSSIQDGFSSFFRRSKMRVKMIKADVLRRQYSCRCFDDTRLTDRADWIHCSIPTSHTDQWLLCIPCGRASTAHLHTNDNNEITMRDIMRLRFKNASIINTVWSTVGSTTTTLYSTSSLYPA